MRYQQFQCYQLCDGRGIAEEHIEIGPGSMIQRERHVYRYVYGFYTVYACAHGVYHILQFILIGLSG